MTLLTLCQLSVGRKYDMRLILPH